MSSKSIDIRKVFKENSPHIYKKLPNFILTILEKIIHQNEINEFLQYTKNIFGIDLVNKILKTLEVKTSIKKLAKIDNKNSSLIFVANHPLGGIDSLSFLSITSHHYGESKIISNNTIATSFHNLKSILLYMKKSKKISKQNVLEIQNTLNSNTHLLLHPAAIVSRRNPVKIKDYQWNSFFIKKAIQYKRDVVPVHINAKNSNLFYNISTFRKLLCIKSNLELFLLPNELFNKKKQIISFTFGDPIPYTTFDHRFSVSQWAEKVKEYTYLIDNKKYKSNINPPTFKEAL